jgi:tetratricopeptide (TPR) repeat protein
MKRFVPNATVFVLLLAFVCLAAAQKDPSTQSAPASEVTQLVVQSQQALDQQDEKKAITLVEDGLVRFPNHPDLQVQRARIHVYQKQDKQAISLLHAVLLANPDHRNAKLLLAQIYGYRSEFQQSDRIYQTLLAADPKDEAAGLGLVHNLILEGKREQAQLQAKDSLEKNPNSLELQRYADYLASNPRTEGARSYTRRLQDSHSYFSDTSGNHSVYSAQGFVYQFKRNFTNRARLEETTLWKTGSNKLTLLSGMDESRYRINRYVAVRAGVGGARFADGFSRVLYSGDLELFPVKNLYLSGGYLRTPVSPTFDAQQFDLLARGWRTVADYHIKGFTLAAGASFYHYSDSNHAEREWGEAMKWFGMRDNTFSVGGGYVFRHLHFTKELGHGYFSPGEYRSHLAAAGMRLRVGKWYRAELLGYGGGELLKDFGSYSPAGEALFRNDFTFGQFILTADYSHYHLIQTTGAFRADAVSASFGYKF